MAIIIGWFFFGRHAVVLLLQGLRRLSRPMWHRDSRLLQSSRYTCTSVAPLKITPLYRYHILQDSYSQVTLYGFNSHGTRLESFIFRANIYGIYLIKTPIVIHYFTSHERLLTTVMPVSWKYPVYWFDITRRIHSTFFSENVDPYFAALCFDISNPHCTCRSLARGVLITY